jgi:hypothetical protein
MAKARTTTAEPTNGPGPLTRAEAGTKEKVCRTVRIRGVTPIMFDRYPGDNDTQLEPWQKMYYLPDNKTLCLPATNVISALSAQNTDSWPKRILDSRKYKDFCFACASSITILPDSIPFTRDGEPVVFGRFVGETDPQSGVYIRRDVARLEKGIPNPKVRPVLPLPWGLEFQLVLWPNPDLQESQLLNVFTRGLFQFGLGTWRGQFGKGEVIFWE